ncbi:hypothetical protein GCM10009736_29140 [Actinomadura bangladeshensis]
MRPSDPSDCWWLLHELRSRSEELPKIAQGRQVREISRRAFSRLELPWPGPEVRGRFQEVVEPLHDRAHSALEENRLLEELLDRVLRDVSSVDGLRTPVASGDVMSGGTPRALPSRLPVRLSRPRFRRR